MRQLASLLIFLLPAFAFGQQTFNSLIIKSNLTALGSSSITNLTLDGYPFTVQELTPMMFGAVGDGSTDDTVALNLMFSSGGKRYNLAGRTYSVSNPEQASNAPGYYWTNAVNANISGAVISGPGVIRSGAATNVGIVLLQINGDDNVIEGVTFDGNFTAPSESDTSGIGLRVYGSGNRILGNVFTNSGYMGLQMESSQSVPGNDFPTNSVTLGENVVMGNLFYDSHTTAILTKPGGVRRTIISDNIIVRYGLAGMKVDAEPPSSDGAAGQIVISGNVISDGSVSLGYSASTGAQGGITLEEGLSDVVITGNSIVGGTNTTGGAGFRGIYLSAGQSDKDVKNVTITGNHVRNLDGEGILLRVTDAGRFDNVTISGGDIAGVGGFAIVSSTLGSTKGLIGSLVIDGISIRDCPYGIQLTDVVKSANVSASMSDIGVSGIVATSITNCVIRDTVIKKYGLTNASARGIQLVQCSGFTIQDVLIEGSTSGLYGIEFVGTHSSTVRNLESSWNRSHGILVTSSSTNLVFSSIFGKNNGQNGSGYLMNLSSGDDIIVNGICGVDDTGASKMPYVLVAGNGVDVIINGISGRGYSTSLYTFSGAGFRNVVVDFAGYGTPEASVVAAPGAVYRNMNGGAGTTLYVKESGTGNTGWVAK